MPQLFRLYWLRETGCDAGTPLRADELDPTIRDAVTEVAGDSPEVVLHLPYLDRREWRRRGEVLPQLIWTRQGDAIFPKLSPGGELRTVAANLALTDPVWIRQPGLSDPRHILVWKDVSIALQRSIREWVAQEYFRDINRLEDRATAYQMIVYQAARVFHSPSRGVFTYDFRDYPECETTVALATKMTGRAIQNALVGHEERLHAAGNDQLARRYAPVWHQDVLVAVRKKPKLFIELLAAESAFIDALVELGMNRTHAGVQYFGKVAGKALRRVSGMDLRHLGTRALLEATRVLEEHPRDGGNNLFHGGTIEDDDAIAAGSPDLRIAS